MKYNSKFTRIVGVGLSSVMLASTLLTATPAFADVSSAAVTVSPTTISAVGNYTITFHLNTSLANSNSTGNITIVFPSDTTTSNASLAGNVTIQATAGFGTAISETTVGNNASAVTVASNLRTVTIRLGELPNAIGEDATVRIRFLNAITNPSAAGNYTLTVATGNETTAVTSAEYTITLPSISPLPGTVTGKNAAGNILYQAITSNLTTVVGTTGVKTIELGAGTYNATSTNNLSTVNQTIIGVGAAGTVILTAAAGTVPLTVTATGVVVRDVVIQGNAAGVDDLVDVSANSTFDNVTFNGGVNQLDIAAGSGLVTVTNSIFNVTGNVAQGINADPAVPGVLQVTVTNCTFNVDASGDAIESTGNLTVTGSTFTGTSTSPDGIETTNGTNRITGNTFTNMQTALSVGGSATNSTVTGTLTTFENNTITGRAGTTDSASVGSIIATGNGALIMTNNVIQNGGTVRYGLVVTGGNVSAHLNSFLNNSLNILQTSGTANATLNWWGSASGPAGTSLNATDSGLLITAPFLVGSPSNGTAGFNTANLTAAATTGVDVTSANASTGSTIAADLIVATRYATNPQAAAPAGNPIAYFDVAVQGISSGATVTIKFYGNVTEDTKVYYGGGLTGAWGLVSNQGVNVAGGYAFVTVTATTAPALTDLDTPFVLTNIVTAPAAPALAAPAAGATGVSIATGFSWTAVPGATSYNFQLSTVPNFATTLSNQTGLTSTVAGGVTLAANTTYFWRVQAVNSGGTSAWTTGTFSTNSVGGGAVVLPPISNNITVPPPIINVAPAQVTVQPPNVTVNPPNVTVQPPPPANVTVNPPQVTVTAPPPANVTVEPPIINQAIPTYILWTIILIGAVLVIALIVLIVRTRRVA